MVRKMSKDNSLNRSFKVGFSSQFVASPIAVKAHVNRGRFASFA